MIQAPPKQENINTEIALLQHESESAGSIRLKIKTTLFEGLERFFPNARVYYANNNPESIIVDMDNISRLLTGIMAVIRSQRSFLVSVINSLGHHKYLRTMAELRKLQDEDLKELQEVGENLNRQINAIIKIERALAELRAKVNDAHFVKGRQYAISGEKRSQLASELEKCESATQEQMKILDKLLERQAALLRDAIDNGRHIEQILEMSRKLPHANLTVNS